MIKKCLALGLSLFSLVQCVGNFNVLATDGDKNPFTSPAGHTSSDLSSRSQRSFAERIEFEILIGTYVPMSGLKTVSLNGFFRDLEARLRNSNPEKSIYIYGLRNRVSSGHLQRGDVGSICHLLVSEGCKLSVDEAIMVLHMDCR